MPFIRIHNKFTVCDQSQPQELQPPQPPQPQEPPHPQEPQEPQEPPQEPQQQKTIRMRMIHQKSKPLLQPQEPEHILLHIVVTLHLVFSLPYY